MPSQRAVLEMLTRSDLLMLATHHEIQVEDRRVRDQLIAGLLRISFREALTALSAASLKHLVVEFDLTPANKKKDALVEALVVAATPKRAAKKAASKARTQSSAAKTSATRAVGNKKASPKLTAAPIKAAPKTKMPKKAASSSKKATGAKLENSADQGVARPAGAAKKSAKGNTRKNALEARPKGEGRKKRQVSASAASPSEAIDSDKASEEQKTPSPKRPGQISSWAEVALAAAARGQSAESMLKPVGPARHVHTNARKCAACGEKLSLRKCSVQACDHMLLAESRQKICAECRFERNTLSMTDFEEVLSEERACPHCEKSWRKGA